MPAANTYQNPSTPGGNREDLMDILTIVEPESFPVSSRINKGAAPKAVFSEWLVDNLRAARIGGVPEGQDVGSFNNKASKRKRIGNYVQIFRDEYAVTDLQELVEVAAVDDEYAYAKYKCAREIKRDIELTICSGQDRQVGAADLPYLTRGLFNWITNPGPADVPPEVWAPTGAILTTGSATTEDQLNGLLQALFEVQGGPKQYLGAFGTNLIRQVDNFTRLSGASDSSRNRYTVMEDASSHIITVNVKRFQSTFGDIDFVPDVFLNPTPGTISQNAGLILNMDLLELGYLDRLHSMDLPDIGGGPRGYTKGILQLRCFNPRGLGKIT
jgi:Family of unknown function (DUF5309)